MRVLFVYPNSTGYSRVPMGIAILSSCLKKAGHQVKVFDTSFYKLKTKTDDQIREQLGQVKKTDLSKYGVTFATKTKEEIFDELKCCIEKYKPGLCAFSSNEEQLHYAYMVAENIKTYSNVPIIFGGVSVTTSPLEIIKKAFVDMACIGEGEEAIVELANAMEEGKDVSDIKNIWSKRNGSIIKNDVRQLVDINTLPFADVDEFSDKHFYRPFDGKVYRMLMFEMIRGCAFRCSYCNNSIMMDLYKNKGKFVRRKGIKRTIDELEYLKNKYNVELFFFIDDDFLHIKEAELEELMKEYRRRVKVPFIVQGTAKLSTLKKFEILKKSNCLTVAMSIESGSDTIRKSILNRKVPNNVIINAFQLAKKIGLKANSQNIIGIPDETRKDIFETIEINRKCQAYSISTNFMTPFKGTEIRNNSVERGYIDPAFSVTTGIRGRPVLKLPQISDEELIGIQKVFSLYVKLPKYAYALIRYCESDRIGSEFIYNKLQNWMWKRTDSEYN